ncbi:hypothetical protein GJ699_32125 [Duganella sp. FT80W]|uniref:Protein NO VEIN C-terminal domain-containing protein n=1 Tax=Duganella guangzhouensis TaxID=2666084 RepID=A0A6I2L8P9_9BURK|nr:hypothetical protein [Duganella guangzhouensis]MRW94625.1 hypothetical protein [Duganella guangzhouensis]
MDLAKQLATSTVMLALARNGYFAYQDTPLGADLIADVFAARKSDTDTEERFVVEVKSAGNWTAIPMKIENLRQKRQRAFQHTVYFSFFIERECLLMVDDELRKRMRFVDDQITLEVFPSKRTDLPLATGDG